MIIWEYIGPDALQGGHIGRLKVNLRNYFCIFYSFELKLCRMVELCIAKKSYVFLFFDFNLFLAGMRRHKIDSKINISRYGKRNNYFKKSTMRWSKMGKKF